jgi:hypothetical protein
MNKARKTFLGLGAVIVLVALAATVAIAQSGNGTPPGFSPPAGATVSGMPLLCKLPADHLPPRTATLDQVKALCAQYGRPVNP